jgi:hypothetical protein
MELPLKPSLLPEESIKGAFKEKFFGGVLMEAGNALL